MTDPTSLAPVKHLANDHWGVRLASYLLMAAALLLVMLVGLLPGLLAVCVGFALTGVIIKGFRRFKPHPASRWAHWLPTSILRATLLRCSTMRRVRWRLNPSTKLPIAN